MSTLEKNILKIISESKYEWLGYSFIQYEMYHKYGCYRYINDDIVEKVLNRLVKNKVIDVSTSVICYDQYFIIRDFIYKLK